MDLSMNRVFAIAAGCLAALALAVVGAAVLRLASTEIGSDVGLRASPREASRIYSRPLALRTGRMLGADALEAYLVATSHRRVDAPEVGIGEYAVDGRGFWIVDVSPMVASIRRLPVDGGTRCALA